MPTAAAPISRPRHLERTGFYRLLEQHFERFVREYDERGPVKVHTMSLTNSVRVPAAKGPAETTGAEASARTALLSGHGATSRIRYGRQIGLDLD